MLTINLGATTWSHAETNLQLEVTGSASLHAPELLSTEAGVGLLAGDRWIHKGHNFHFSFHVYFNNSLSEADALDEDAYAGFIASVLTQASLWSQLHLVPSVSAPVCVTSECGVNGRILTLNLEQDRDSDSDLTNVKPPNAIAAISLDSFKISLTFSSTTRALKKLLPFSGKASSEFEDLLGLEYHQEILEPDLGRPDWQYREDEALEDHVALFEMLFHPSPQALQREFHDQLGSSSYLLANPGSSCLPDSSFHSLEAYDSTFSSQSSALACQLEEDTIFSDNQFVLMTHDRETSTISSKPPTFHSLEPDDSSLCRSAKKQTAFSDPVQTACIPGPPRDTTLLQKPVLSLLDTALRTLIHPQPTRLPVGIKPVDPPPSREKTTNRTPLSSLAPSIFTPDYARAVAQRAPLVSSIAKSLATFLSHRAAGSGPDPRSRLYYNADPQDASEAAAVDEADGTTTQESLKETLRGHVWMTMTNGLRISHREKARRLKPLTAMPAVQWRERTGSRGEQIEVMETDTEMEMEMLTCAFVPETSSSSSSSSQTLSTHAKDLDQELEILEAFRSRGVVTGTDANADADGAGEDEELLLFDDDDAEGDEEEADLSFLEDEFEELCLFERVVDDAGACGSGGGGGGRGSSILAECFVVDGDDHNDDDDNHGDGMEEMLF